MILSCFFIAHAIASHFPNEVDLPIRYHRPSKIVEILTRTPMQGSNQIEADDVEGCVKVQGTPDFVTGIKDIVKLLDIPRRKVSLKVTIDSTVDKQKYQVSTRIYEEQQWKTGDGDTGVTVGLEPRINGDHTVTIMAECTTPNHVSTEMVFRVKPGGSQSICLPGLPKPTYMVDAKGNKTVKSILNDTGLKVTIQVER